TSARAPQGSATAICHAILSYTIWFFSRRVKDQTTIKRYFSLGVGGSLTCSRAYGRLRSTESKHAVQADHAFFDERILEQSSGFVYVRRRPLLVLGRWLVGPYEATQLLDQWRERLGDTALERFDRVGTARGPGDDLVGERVGVLAPRGRQLREI